MNGLFKRVGAVSPGRSVFDLSYEKTFTADMGYLYPIMCDEVVPGDLFEIGNEVVIRFQPLVSYDARSELLRALFLRSVSSIG